MYARDDHTRRIRDRFARPSIGRGKVTPTTIIVPTEDTFDAHRKIPAIRIRAALCQTTRHDTIR